MKLNDFVDEVFVVNLFSRPDRLQSVTKELEKFDIKFHTWAATKSEDGRRGLRMTMVELFLYCIDQNLKRVCVFEDDIKIISENFTELLSDCFEQLPEDFHLFYMGGRLLKPPTKKSKNILQTSIMYATHAVIYSRFAIEYLLKKMEDQRAYDTIIVGTIQMKNKCYCSYPLLVSQKQGYSDIEKMKVNYEKYIEETFAKKTMGI